MTATAMQRRGICLPRTISRRATRRRAPGTGSSGHARPGVWRRVGAGVCDVPVSEREPCLDDLVRRSHARDDALERVRGPAGFYIVRGGPSGDDAVRDSRTGGKASLPGPAPRENDKFPSNKPYREIPIAIQDRSFNADGSLFYPDSRVFFDGIVEDYIPEGEFSPIWNPEVFGNTIMVNGNTWPFQTVEKRRYRFRFLNGCQSRFLILDFNAIPGVEVWQIGNEGGFLAAPVNITADHGNRLLMGLAERADVIVDFSNVPAGNYVLGNVGPDEPFGGGVPGSDFPVADPGSTGQVMQFRVVPAVGANNSTLPRYLRLPAITPLPASTLTRQLALIEEASEGADETGEELEGPVAALLGTVAAGEWIAREWMDAVTENPAIGETEIWEIYNATADAHPMHIHEITFEVVNRQDILVDEENREVQVHPDPSRSLRSPGRLASKTPSSPTPHRSHESKASSGRPASWSGTATSSNTKTTNDAPLPHRTRATRPTRVNRRAPPQGRGRSEQPTLAMVIVMGLVAGPSV